MKKDGKEDITSEDVLNALGAENREEMQNGINNLEKVNYKVDYIISHCCPTSYSALYYE